MKKLTIIFLLLIYGFTAIGVTIHMHYCMNEFVNWSLEHGEHDGQCGKCGMERKGDCCKDEHKQVKLEDKHHKTTAFEFLQLLNAPVPPSSVSTGIVERRSILQVLPLFHLPPKAPAERIYILHAVLLI